LLPRSKFREGKRRRKGYDMAGRSVEKEIAKEEAKKAEKATDEGKE
jgi:hypothetical protein